MPAPILALLLAAGAAGSRGVSVTPEVVELSAARPYAELTVRNVGATAREVRTGVLAWSQDESGRVVLANTAGADVFPGRAVLLPGEERRFRVSCREPPGALERAYRVAVYVRDLEGMGAVTVLVPAFFAPAHATTAPVIRVTCGLRSCRVVVENGGTVRFRPHRLAIALVCDGGARSERNLAAWWVLAGGARAYDVPLDAGAPVREVVALLDLAGAELSTAAAVGP